MREVRLEMQPVSDPVGGTVDACVHVCMCVLCGYVLHNMPTHIPMHILRIERKEKQNSLEEVSVTHCLVRSRLCLQGSPAFWVTHQGCLFMPHPQKRR